MIFPKARVAFGKGDAPWIWRARCEISTREYLNDITVHNKVISGFQALRQARAPVAGLEPATEGSLQISGRTRKPLCYRRIEGTI
ncbi:hypothetical protein PoB_004288600 [Plakobranchus ocellatus]|uniref:Uncharacterized protein n=1 Tax=Plakobranchus ocellatus TaxID=259542 RepID=A0AAV4BC09_9GAST|nr:hypothetical protein PoB_004288600 [Plakobranchus ocellatus]